MAKSNVPGRFFRFFRRSVGRPLADGLWPSWFGGKEKPPTSADFRDDADSGGKLRRGYRRLTTPPCVLKHHAPWGIGAHITYIISLWCQANSNGDRGVPRRGRTSSWPSWWALRSPSQVAFPGLLTALMSLLLHKKHSDTSSFVRQWKTVCFVSKVCKWNIIVLIWISNCSFFSRKWKKVRNSCSWWYKFHVSNLHLSLWFSTTCVVDT